jgi:hypothetical protein
METSKDIKGQGAKRVFFGINMRKDENPSKQNDILVKTKVGICTKIVCHFDNGFCHIQ